MPMTVHHALRIGLALLVSAGAARADGPVTGTWKAGAAAVKITPEKLMWMSGYAARTKPAEGTLTDLWAKALVLEDPDGRRAVAVTMDLVGIPRDLAIAVCGEIERKYGLRREAVLLSVSHTHAGPVVGDNLRTMFDFDDAQQKLVREYEAALRAKLVGVVGAALAGLAPADLAWGTGHVTFAVNRRNNKEADVPKLREQGRLKGPVDHDVPVLAVRAKDGSVRAVLFAYACHATVLSFYQWSGDYPGYAQSALEKAHPGATALFVAGCGGDQNPLPRRTPALAEEYGRELAQGVDAVLRAPMTPVTSGLATAYTEVTLPFGDLPTREQLLKDATNANYSIANRARRLLDELTKNGSIRGTYPYPVQAWQIGSDLTLIALGGEVVVDYSLRLKRELGRERTWVAAYSNDVMAYIPSLRVLKEGGYEGGGAMAPYGLPAAWGPKVEEIIVAAVREQVQKVRGAVAGRPARDTMSRSATAP
jgi:hypothetical protein